MQENNKRKEWIKTFAIIFLSVLLVLTFFSNTIQNYSLPEVAAQYTWSGSITKKVRGEGTIESTDPYAVQYAKARKIESVAVRVGDEVQKGDTLFVLAPGESEELKTAKKELDSLKEEYERNILKNQISSEITNAVENGGTSFDAGQDKIAKLKKNIESAEKAVDEIEAQIQVYEKETDETIPEIAAYIAAQNTLKAWTTQQSIVNNQANIDKLNAAMKDAEKAYNDAKAAYDALKDKPDTNKKKIAAKKTLDAKKKAYSDAKKAVSDNEAAIDTAEIQLPLAEAAAEKAKDALDKKISELQTKKEDAEKAVQDAKDALENYSGDLSTEYELLDQLKAIEEKEKEVKDLTEKEGGNEITAPVAGTVLSLSYVAGETIQTGEESATVATLQLAGKGYTLSMSVSNEQATLLRVGDEAEVTNSWWYSDVHAKVTSIRPDRDNPGQSKIVTFDVQGDVMNGQTLTLTVGQRTATYDNVVPNSAVREDNKGKFVYRVTSKSTPLGSRYYAERVDVTVLAEDETQTAISGALEGWEYIITTSSKPIEEGQQIRLKD